MTNHKLKDVDKECPICGGIIWGRGIDVIIEGAKMRVCQSCAKNGKKIINKQTQRPASRRREKYTRKTSSSKISKRVDSYFEPDIVLVDNFNEKIRHVRERNNLTQAKFAQSLQEKESLIRRIEQKKTKPTIKLAKKIQNTYNITLLKESDAVKVDTSKYIKKRDSGVSLGSFIKKKKKD